MPVFTTKITGSDGAGLVQFSGSMRASGFMSANGFGNSSSIDTSVTVPRNFNSLLYGPITIGSAGTFTIGEGSTVKIKDIEDA